MLDRIIRSISNPNKWVQQTRYIFIICNVILGLAGWGLFIPGVVFASNSDDHNHVTYNHLIIFGVIVLMCATFGLVSAYIQTTYLVARYMLLLAGVSFLESLYVIVIIGFLLDRWVRSVLHGSYRAWIADTGWKYIFVIVGIVWTKLVCCVLAYSFFKNLKSERLGELSGGNNRTRTQPKTRSNGDQARGAFDAANAAIVTRTDYNLFFQLFNKFLRRQQTWAERRESSC